MGWTGLHREKGISDLDFFRRELSGLDDDGNPRLIATARVGFTVYGAYKSPLDDQPIVGLVILTRQDRSDYFNYYYKALDEDMGPYEYRCPEKILDLLTPTDSESGNEWRAKCREYHVARKATPKVSKGDTIFVKSGYYSGAEGRFTALDVRKGLFESETGRRVFLRGWRNSPWEKVSA